MHRMVSDYVSSYFHAKAAEELALGFNLGNYFVFLTDTEEV